MKIEVSDVKGEEASVWCRYDAVDEEFGESKVTCWGGSGAIIRDAIASDSETDTMGFRFEGANGSHDATIGDLCTFRERNIRISDELDGVGAFGW